MGGVLYALVDWLFVYSIDKRQNTFSIFIYQISNKEIPLSSWVFASYNRAENPDAILVSGSEIFDPTLEGPEPKSILNPTRRFEDPTLPEPEKP